MVSAEFTGKLPASSGIWVTEFNIMSERSSPSAAGTWMHGLYVAAMAAAMMEQPSLTVACNHVLVGDANFAAMFADERTLRAPVFPGLDRQSTGSVAPFAFSASGLALELFSRTIREKQKATLLEIPQAAASHERGLQGTGQRPPQNRPTGGYQNRDRPMMRERGPYSQHRGQGTMGGRGRDFQHGGQAMVDSGGTVYGWLFHGSVGEWSAFILNLSGSSLTLQADFLTPFDYEQLSADPGLVVSRDKQLQPVTGEGTKSLSLRPFSITGIHSR
jgi:hypothetical protein